MRVNHKELYDAMQILTKVVDHKSSIAALQCIYIKAENGKATLSATDIDQWLQVELPAEGDMVACIPCRQFIKLVRAGKKKTKKYIDLDVVDTGTVDVTCQGVTTRLVVFDHEDYPLPSTDTWKAIGTADASQLAAALQYTLPAASRDTTRLHLNSIYLESNGAVVSTDGHRAHLASNAHELTESILMSRDAAIVIEKILKGSDSVEFFVDSDEKLRVTAGHWTLQTKILEETFPPYRSVFPKLSAAEMILDVETKVFRDAIKHVATVTTKDKPGVTMTINGVVSLEAEQPDVGKAQINVDTIENTHNPEEKDYVIGYNPKYMLDALGKSNTAMLHFDADHLSPIRVDLDGRMAVVMPTRL